MASTDFEMRLDMQMLFCKKLMKNGLSNTVKQVSHLLNRILLKSISELHTVANCGESDDKPTSHRLTSCSNMYTTILGAEKDKTATLSLSRALKRSGQVVLDNLNTVMQKSSTDDPVRLAKNLIEYVRKESTTSLIIICSPTLCSLLEKNDTVTLQINGNITMINAKSLKQLINEQIRAKIILVTFSSLSVSIPEPLHGCEHQILTDSNPEVEISKISIERLQSALTRRNKELGMHQ